MFDLLSFVFVLSVPASQLSFNVRVFFMSSSDDFYAYVSLQSLRSPSEDDLSAERGVRLTRTATHLRHMDSLLAEAISSMQADRNAVLRELEKILAFQAPVRRVPVEILSTIFELVADSCRDALEIAREVAALRTVCAFWAYVADGTPRLWTGAFTVPWLWCQSHLELNARLSRSLPMTVEQNVRGEDSIANSAFAHLLGTGERWQSAVLRASWSCFASSAHPEHYARLTTAKLYLEGDAISGALRWLQHADVLDTLTLVCGESQMSGLFTLDVPAWPRLSSLTLCGLRDGTVRFIVSLVRACSSVEYLRVDSLVDTVDDDIDVADVSVISMPALRTLRLDNHTGFMLAIVSAPHLQRLTLNDFDDFRPGIFDLHTMLHRPGVLPRLEELTIARVDSCLEETSSALLQCLQRLQWLTVLDINDCSVYAQSLGSAFLFDSLTFRYGSPILLPSLSMLEYTPAPNGMPDETANALDEFAASRRCARVVGDVVVQPVDVSVSEI